MAVEVVEAGSGLPEAGVGAEVNTPEATPGSVERSTLESRVADGLKAVFDDSDTTGDTASEKTVVAGNEVVKEGEEETPTEEAAVEEEVAKDEQEKEKPAAVATPKTSTLPAAYVRSLKALGWEDAEIEGAAANPAFLTTAAKLHQTRNQELAQWAQIGRAKQQENAAQQAQNPQPQGFQALAPADAAALKKQYGNDELIDALVGPLNATVAQINAMLPVIQQTQQSSQQAHLQTLNRQVETFFGDAELKPYAELYGVSANGQQLTAEQVKARNAVLQTADALVVGAAAQGRSLTVQEALALAHDSTSGGFKTKAARETLKGQMQKRGQSVTLKPTGVKGIAPAKTGDRGSLERATKARLAAAFA